MNCSTGITTEQTALIGEITNLKFVWSESTNIEPAVLLCGGNQYFNGDSCEDCHSNC